ncbi:uncharacterized protein LOC100679329 [Nasonia vitripennis]|uniref:Uncharacterized protein n=1 Tax=Nasonia vitripennis TaxID=7425 RepID=A0A7M7GCK3_NASVI|nr:uncharacterized protein LOC100679329 [Nasonia vitripennis]XP_003425892.1 uncharacterized protein LOC100679329 [Nasonia vitripennis]
MDRKKKTPPRGNTADRVGRLAKPTIQMSAQSYTTPVNTGHRNHPVQNIITASGNASQQLDSTPVNTRQQMPKTPGIVRQPVNQTPGNARQQINQTPGSSNSQQNYSTPGSAIQDYSTPSQQDYTIPGNSCDQNNYSHDETHEQQLHGLVNPSNSQTANEALRGVSYNIEKIKSMLHLVELRIYQIKGDIDGMRNRVEEALLLFQQQEDRLNMVQKLKEIKRLEDELNEHKVMMKLVERQLHEHIEYQKHLELSECNYQMKKRQFEAELHKNRDDFQKLQRYRDESYQQQQQKIEQENDTAAEIAKTMPEVSEIERMAEKAIAAEEATAAAEAEATVEDTQNQRKAEGIPKVRFRVDDNEMNN